MKSYHSVRIILQIVGYGGIAAAITGGRMGSRFALRTVGTSRNRPGSAGEGRQSGDGKTKTELSPNGRCCCVRTCDDRRI